MKRHSVLIPTVLTFLLGIPLAVLLWKAPLLPPNAVREGDLVDFLFRLIAAIAGFVFALIVSFVGYSLIAFRRRPGDTSDGPPMHGNVPLEVTWTVVPLLVIFGVGFLGTWVLFEIDRPKPNEMTVRVTGFQFAWLFEYPAYGIRTNELVLPVEQPIKFEVTATDVIHSFWVPEFRMKIDTIPGRINVKRYTPTRIGEYTLRCAELCGAGHYAMLARVRVVSGSEFLQWVAQQSGAQAPEETLSPLAARGKELSDQLGCLACHTTDGSPSVGPTWKGLFGKEEPLADGTTVLVDEAYLRTSILRPGEQIVAGYQNIMPAYEGRLSDEDLEAIIEYIKTLK